MNKDEFIQNSVALIGTSLGWQSEIARRLGVSDRHIRRIVAGQANVADGLAKDLLDLLGERAPQVVHAEWIIGAGSDGREYLIHTHHPRFQCLVIDQDNHNYDLENDNGVQFTSGDYVLAGFLWLDRMPENITDLMEAACDFIDHEGG